MNKHQYSLYEAKLFSKFPGKTTAFARFLRNKGYLKSRNRAHEEYIRHGWFDHKERIIIGRANKKVIQIQLIITERGIGFLKWLVQNHSEEINEKRIMYGQYK
jgi:hypothetical protein